MSLAVIWIVWVLVGGDAGNGGRFHGWVALMEAENSAQCWAAAHELWKVQPQDKFQCLPMGVKP